MALSTAGVARAIEKLGDAASKFVHRRLHVETYRRTDADLNGDGRSDVFVYATDRGHCGSGGCTLIVLSPQERAYRVVLRCTATQLPILLLETSTAGWRDVGVAVAGGGIDRPYAARLRYNGRHYPSNPTVAPAIPLDEPSGRILIGS